MAHHKIELPTPQPQPQPCIEFIRTESLHSFLSLCLSRVNSTVINWVIVFFFGYFSAIVHSCFPPDAQQTIKIKKRLHCVEQSMLNFLISKTACCSIKRGNVEILNLSPTICTQRASTIRLNEIETRTWKEEERKKRPRVKSRTWTFVCAPMPVPRATPRERDRVKKDRRCCRRMKMEEKEIERERKRGLQNEQSTLNLLARSTRRQQ